MGKLISILDSLGCRITNWKREAFLEMPEELWDPERKRLTIFFDPGRIKRGVQPNLQLGLPLVAGRSYRLEIDKHWLDEQGATLLDNFQKEFEVLSVDRNSPNPKLWSVDVPSAGSKEPLRLDFHEAMDYGLLNSALAILTRKGEVVSGRITISNEEQTWHFVPLLVWAPGTYQIAVNTWLEDLAGNNIRRKFDVDLNNPEDTPLEMKVLNIPFELTKHKL